ncbi:putative O-linked N-acetylglucosamine transferase, SPINDLY family [Xenococcus sp. PCC 7305]|uniref:O-linked N-acetylglucosamine transferase family protein n=1 Tax=Xenococcus sp. PCC 7305 TaxID=102125 RepID=UPI0002AC48E2|nr:tetratricopeptide repeat protein [Xenococcus sp. PCC 7305]ELS04100.1 putative O-linked N-acetylglucosamine transferase, SPINDLY family [Xenococcus sp. PCC 7305]
MPKIYYFCPDYQLPSGGTRTLYWQVAQLRSSGLDAWIVHQKSEFSLTWHDIRVPITSLEDNPHLKPSDILVFPEVMLPTMQQMASIAARKVVVALNWAPAYLNLEATDSWANYGIQAALFRSPIIANYVKWRMNLPVAVVPTHIDSGLYYYKPAAKKPLIAYMTRKAKDAAIVHRVLEQRGGLFANFTWQALRDSSQAEYASCLRQATFYIPPSAQEGENISVLEAMACGCIVVGYHGIGGKDFMIREGQKQNCVLVENGNLPELGLTMEKTLRDWTANPESFARIIQNAIATGQKAQDTQQEAQALAKFFRNLPSISSAIAINSDKNHNAALSLIEQARKLKQAGQLEQARTCYQEALGINDTIPEAWYNYGNLLSQLALKTEAAQAYKKALELQNNFFQAHLNLANCLRDSDLIEEAIVHYRQVINIKPNFTLAYRNLTQVLVNLNRSVEVIEICQAWLAIEPHNLFALNALGISWQSQGKYQPALSCFQQAVKNAPNSADSLNNLGTLLRMLKRPQEALPYLRRSIELNPDNDITQSNFLYALLNLGKVSEAIAQADDLLQRNANLAGIRLMQGFALTYQARISEAIASYDMSWQLDPAKTAPISNALFSMLYRDDLSPTELVQERSKWVNRLPTPPIKYEQWQSDPNPHRPLKIGYLSGDLRTHPVAFFLEPILVNHNAREVTSFCYDTGGIEDQTTTRLQNYSDRWINCAGWDDLRLAEQIHNDAIDILVDLSGHTSGNRTQVLRCQPAPIQMIYIGYPESSGLAEIDYIIADQYVAPADLDYLYTEKILHVAGSFWCFLPQDFLPEPQQLPALKNGYLTFGSFNNSSKISPTTIRLWSQVLKAVPNSRLLLKALALEDKGTCEYFRGQFVAQGIDGTRVILEKPTLKIENFFESYHKIDIALDPFPYNGGTTTCQALWMGVPVISLRGQQFCSRMSHSFLTNLGLPELSVATEADYIAIAVELAQDLTKLSQMRANLRSMMKKSPIMNGTLAAEELEKAYRRAWQEVSIKKLQG